MRPSAGTMSPASSMHDVTRHELRRRQERRARRRGGPSPGGPASWRARRTLARAFISWRVPSTTLNATRRPDDEGGGELADQQADHDDRDEHDVHRVAQLDEGDRPHRRRLLLGDLVGPEAGEPAGGVARRQTSFQCRCPARRPRPRHRGRTTPPTPGGSPWPPLHWQWSSAPSCPVAAPFRSVGVTPTVPVTWDDAVV